MEVELINSGHQGSSVGVNEMGDWQTGCWSTRVSCGWSQTCMKSNRAVRATVLRVASDELASIVCDQR